MVVVDEAFEGRSAVEVDSLAWRGEGDHVGVVVRCAQFHALALVVPFRRDVLAGVQAQRHRHSGPAGSGQIGAHAPIQPRPADITLSSSVAMVVGRP